MKEQHKEGLYRLAFSIISTIIIVTLAIATVVIITEPGKEVTIQAVTAVSASIMLDFARAIGVFAVILGISFSFFYIVYRLDCWTRKKK